MLLQAHSPPSWADLYIPCSSNFTLCFEVLPLGCELNGTRIALGPDSLLLPVRGGLYRPVSGKALPGLGGLHDLAALQQVQLLLFSQEPQTGSRLFYNVRAVSDPVSGRSPQRSEMANPPSIDSLKTHMEQSICWGYNPWGHK